MNWIKKFMLGRYGVDQFFNFLTIIALVFIILSIIFNMRILNIIAIVIIIYAYYRVFSKKVYKRSFENSKFLNTTYPFRSKFRSIKNKVKGLKKYKYFKCSKCNQEVRVPRGKGKVVITCPKCSNKMTRRT